MKNSRDNTEKDNEKIEDSGQSDTISISKNEYEALSEKAKASSELQDRLLRLGAEFENYKKRIQKERQDLIRYAGESFILELLHIIDDFERAFQAADKTKEFGVLHKGVEMILKEAQDFLKDKGVKKMETVGLQFDPHKHEAIEDVVENGKPENTVVEELQAGYELNGKVIRPAKVKVAKGLIREDKGKKE